MPLTRSIGLEDWQAVLEQVSGMVVLPDAVNWRLRHAVSSLFSESLDLAGGCECSSRRFPDVVTYGFVGFLSSQAHDCLTWTTAEVVFTWRDTCRDGSLVALPSVVHDQVESVADCDSHSSPYVEADALLDTRNDDFPGPERKSSMNQLGMLNEFVVQLAALAWMLAAVGVAAISTLRTAMAAKPILKLPSIWTMWKHRNPNGADLASGLQSGETFQIWESKGTQVN